MKQTIPQAATVGESPSCSPEYPDCMHCGLCLQVCPTYLETANENLSPRGRLYLMKAVEEGRLSTADVTPALDLCLDCRACEQACPSGVQYSRLLEPFRVKQHQDEKPRKGFAAWLQKEVVPNRRRLTRFLAPVRLLQKLGLGGLLRVSGRLLPKGMRQLLEQLPRLQPTEPELPEHLPAISIAGSHAARTMDGAAMAVTADAAAKIESKTITPEPNPEGPRAKRVGMFLGCAAEAMYPGVNRATIRVLQAYGCEIFTPEAQVCCGALPYHEGRADEALNMLATNAVVFGGLPRLDAIVVNAAGCGATLKEAGVLGREIDCNKPKLHAALDHMANQVQDINQFLHSLPQPKFNELKLKAVYDDACHLKHAQGISIQPRELLKQIPGLELLDLPEADLCCGAAGNYALNQPQMSKQLGHRKAQHILETGADIVITSNIGCQIQLEKSLREQAPPGVRIQVFHPMEVLGKALPPPVSL